MLVDLNPRQLHLLETGMNAYVVYLGEKHPNNALTPDLQQECIELAELMDESRLRAVDDIALSEG